MKWLSAFPDKIKIINFIRDLQHNINTHRNQLQQGFNLYKHEHRGKDFHEHDKADGSYIFMTS